MPDGVTRRTRIVATLGPATHSAERIAELIQAGMDVARLSFSHGTHEDHAHRAATVRAQAERAGRAVAILMDLQGPKIRTGPLKDDAVHLESGQRFTITRADVHGDAERVGTTFPDWLQDMRHGDRILFSDGLIEMRVEQVTEEEVCGTIVHGGELRPFQGIPLPGVKVSAPCVTAKDRRDLAFGLRQPVDYVALSFVRSPDDVYTVKDLIDGLGRQVPVIAKLEDPRPSTISTPFWRPLTGLWWPEATWASKCPPNRSPIGKSGSSPRPTARPSP